MRAQRAQRLTLDPMADWLAERRLLEAEIERLRGEVERWKESDRVNALELSRERQRVKTTNKALDLLREKQAADLNGMAEQTASILAAMRVAHAFAGQVANLKAKPSTAMRDAARQLELQIVQVGQGFPLIAHLVEVATAAINGKGMYKEDALVAIRDAVERLPAEFVASVQQAQPKPAKLSPKQRETLDRMVESVKNPEPVVFNDQALTFQSEPFYLDSGTNAMDGTSITTTSGSAYAKAAPKRQIEWLELRLRTAGSSFQGVLGDEIVGGGYEARRIDWRDDAGLVNAEWCAFVFKPNQLWQGVSGWSLHDNRGTFIAGAVFPGVVYVAEDDELTVTIEADPMRNDGSVLPEVFELLGLKV